MAQLRVTSKGCVQNYHGLFHLYHEMWSFSDIGPTLFPQISSWVPVWTRKLLSSNVWLTVRGWIVAGNHPLTLMLAVTEPIRLCTINYAMITCHEIYLATGILRYSNLTTKFQPAIITVIVISIVWHQFNLCFWYFLCKLLYFLYIGV